MRPPIPRNIGGPATKSKSEKIKFIDDGTVAVTIDMKSNLVKDAITRQKPLTFNERTCQVLPSENNLLQFYLKDAENFTSQNKMKMNPKKTKIIKFNKSRKHDFPPELFLSGNQMLEVVSEVKLVGVMVSHDLKWQKYTDYICSKARQKLWVLRRLKSYYLETDKLADVYKKEVRSLLEYAVPVWHSSITSNQSRQIERVQKTAFRIILGHDYISYEVACTLLLMEPLFIRRTQLCMNFAKRELKKDQNLFSKTSKNHNTRSTQKLVQEFRCRTSRFQKSSLPFLSKLLNKQY